MPTELVADAQSTDIVARIKNLTIDDVSGWYDELRTDALEMARLKSAFDVKHFTVESVGPFPAHQFHMLLRQQSLAMLELKRMLIDREVLQRDIELLEDSREESRRGYYPDLEIERAKNEIDSLELSIRNKLAMCTAFQEHRLSLVAEHGGQFTDADFQAEERGFWQYTFQTMASHYQLQATTGIPEGLWKNIGLAGANKELPFLQQAIEAQAKELAEVR